MSAIWNPWHGCVKYSEGCAHCYVYRRDAQFGRDSSVARRTADFDLPLRRTRAGDWKIPAGSHVYACMTSDFFLDQAEPWRDAAWDMMRLRPDLSFSVITKRMLWIRECLPGDWGDGWDHVEFGATIENQRRADERMDEFLSVPVHGRFVICEPMLGPVNLSPWLDPDRIRMVVAGGESGSDARCLNYDWVLALRDQCAAAGVAFHFKQTGANFVKDGKLYRIERYLQIPQARRAGIDLPPRSH
jgi:protein gp37